MTLLTRFGDERRGAPTGILHDSQELHLEDDWSPDAVVTTFSLISARAAAAFHTATAL